MKDTGDAERDAALTWAGALAQRHEDLTLAELEAAWSTDEAKKHRAVLKEKSPGILSQLLALMRARIDELKAAQTGRPNGE